MRYVADWNALG